MMIMFTPASTAAVAFSQTSVIALRSAAAPPATGYKIGIVTDLNPASSMCFSFANCSFVSTGLSSAMRLQLFGCGSRRLPSEPIVVSVLVMISSRIQSIGGFVTCAKSCWK